MKITTQTIRVPSIKTFLVQVDSGTGSTRVIKGHGDAVTYARTLSTNHVQTSVWTWHHGSRGTRVVTFFHGEENFAS